MVETGIDPPTLSSTPYELHRQELLALREVTDLQKVMQGVAIELSLQKGDKDQIREKLFDQISGEVGLTGYTKLNKISG